LFDTLLDSYMATHNGCIPIFGLVLLSLVLLASSYTPLSFCRNNSNDPNRYKTNGYYCNGQTSVYCRDGGVTSEEVCDYGCSIGTCDAPSYCESTKVITSNYCGTWVIYQVDVGTSISQSDASAMDEKAYYADISFADVNGTINGTKNTTYVLNLTAPCLNNLQAFACFSAYTDCKDYSSKQCNDACAVANQCMLNETNTFINALNITLNQTNFEAIKCQSACVWGAGVHLAPSLLVLVATLLFGLAGFRVI